MATEKQPNLPTVPTAQIQALCRIRVTRHPTLATFPQNGVITLWPILHLPALIAWYAENCAEQASLGRQHSNAPPPAPIHPAKTDRIS